MIRLWRLEDVFALRNVAESRLCLDTICSLIVPYSPVRAALSSRIPFRRIDFYTYVYEDNGAVEAFAQAQTRRDSDDVDVMCLGASFSGSMGRGADTRDVWVTLLEQLCVTAGRIGRNRIFARLAAGHEEADIFTRVGFAPYCREDVYRLQYSGPVTPPSTGCRPQEACDAWPVHQLYNSTTPKDTRQAEGISSSHWEPRGLRRCRGLTHAAYVMDGKEGIAVYARVSSHRRSHLLEFVFAPEHRHDLSSVIQYVLSTLPGGSGQTVFCLVREYQDGLPDALADHGFAHWGAYDLVVKYTAARVRQPIREHQLAVERRRRMAAQPELGGTSLPAIRFHALSAGPSPSPLPATKVLAR